MSLHPDKLPLIHGLIDGELDAGNTLAIETHLASCGDCRAEYARIEQVRDMLRATPLRGSAPAHLRSRIETMLDAEAGGASESLADRKGPMGHVLSGRWASGALTGALAASLALLVAVPRLTEAGVENQIVQSHVRSLLAGHVVDIPTSDRHVVKPWFNGKVDFAPQVPELVAQGFPLVGGRLDYVDDREVAAIVYRRRLHTINLFVRPTSALASPVGYTHQQHGFTVIRWSDGGIEYWAVSDIGTAELESFRQAYTAAIRR